MLEILNLSDPEVIKVKKVFEANKKSYSKGKKRGILTFDELFTLFSNPANSFAKIGKLDKTCKQNISVKYATYFAPLFPINLETGMGRRKAAKQLRWKNSFNPDSPAGMLVNLMKNKQIPLDICSIPHASGPSKPRKHYIKINDKLIFVAIAKRSTPQPQTIRKYFRFSLSNTTLAKVEFVCFLTKSTSGLDFYVLSKKDFSHHTGRSNVYYIPDPSSPKVGYGARSIIDWEFHKNNWKLLNGSENGNSAKLNAK